MREIVLDTETTGLDPASGHRVVEIGCVELFNHVPTGEVFHRYLNPERDMPAEAEKVHGLTEAFLATHPKFAEVADDFAAFIGDATLVAHNASFDLGFINAEFARVGMGQIPSSRTIDTVAMARKKFPGAQASLDALCRRFGIDLSGRDLHGALLDARLLAAVYLELLGGRQHGLDLAQDAIAMHVSGHVSGHVTGHVPGHPAGQGAGASPVATQSGRRQPRPHEASDAEKAAHAAMLSKLKSPIWLAE